MTVLNFDDFLSKFGNPGKSQVLYGLIIIIVSMQGQIITQFSVVMSYVPEYHCKIPSNEKFFLEKWNIIQNQCDVVLNVNGAAAKIPCPYGWNYITLKGEVYPANEFDLVCDREYLFRLALTLPYIGVMLGGLIFGYLSDKYGRKRILIFVLPALCALTHGLANSPDLTTFIILRFFVGAVGQGVPTICVTYAAELFRHKSRTIVSYIFAFNTALSLPIQMYMMYFLLNWRLLLTIHGFLLLISIVLTLFLPESVTWLVSKHKLQKAEKVLLKYSKVNKLPVSTTLSKDLIVQSQNFDQKESSSVLKKWQLLFCNSSLRKVTLATMYIMFANTCVNSGLSFSISALDGNLYTNYLINGILEVIILAVFLILFTRFGRVKLLISLFISSGLLCGGGYVLIFYSKYWSQLLQTISLFTALISRNLVATSLAMVPQYSAELLPTQLRSTGLGIGVMSGRLGSTLTPQILYTLNHIWEPIPQIVFGIMMLIAAITVAFLPETFNVSLPRTIEDVENIMIKNDPEEKTPLISDKSSLVDKQSEIYQSCESKD